jgi:hypothetical protein
MQRKLVTKRMKQMKEGGSNGTEEEGKWSKTDIQKQAEMDTHMRDREKECLRAKVRSDRETCIHINTQRQRRKEPEARRDHPHTGKMQTARGTER